MSATAADPTRLSPATRLGPVSLTVADLPRAREFYETVIGLQASTTDDGDVVLAAAGGPPLVRLHGDPDAPVRYPRAPWLFHLAIVVPTRRDLADALLRVAQARWPLSGASDHLVSEALYLSDPEGNGIELYRDRPPADWPRDADGTLQMATLRLDLDNLVAEAGPDPGAAGSDAGMPAGTHLGHVHLQVADIPRAETFYADLLGFEPTVRGYPGALFVSAGGYHHHVGLNTWNSAGAPAPAPGATGLRAFEVVLGDEAELARVVERLRVGGVAVEPVGEAPGDSGSARVRDPFGSTVLLRAA